MSNLYKRIISGIVFIAAMLAGLLVNQWLFAALVSVVMVVMLDEFYRMAMGSRHRTPRFFAVFAGLAMFWLLFAMENWDLPGRFLSLEIVPVIAVMLTSIFEKDHTHVDDYAYILTGLVYIAAPLSLSNFIAFRGMEFNAWLLLDFFILIWCSDVGAFVIGSALGKNSAKLAPSISPNKSWAGFFGGLAFCVAGAVILHFVGTLDFVLYHCIALAAVIHCAGVCGDLFESLWKRHFGVKDSGKAIPGHGGMLDRFDSTIIAVPLGAIYLSIFHLL